MNNSLEDAIIKAQTGDKEIRQWLIEEHRPFIIRVASHICKKHIGWNDDEASISLIAFNEAIDRFSEHSSKTFENYSYMIIRNRLIDKFRKDRKSVLTESFWIDSNEDYDLSNAEMASSIEAHEQKQSAEELAQELLRYDAMLQDYGIDLEELEDCSPDHRDTRSQLIRIAKRLTTHPFLLNHLFNTKKLPLKEMLPFVEVSRKTLERNRKYLIALILIYSSDEFIRIRNTVSFAEVGE